MISVEEILSRLRLLAQNELSLHQFEDWFSSASRAMHNDSNENAIELASSIHLLFAERDDLIHNEQSLRLNLLALLDEGSDLYVRLRIRHLQRY